MYVLRPKVPKHAETIRWKGCSHERATPRARQLDWRANEQMLGLLDGEQEDLLDYIDLQHDGLMARVQFTNYRYILL